MRKLDESRRREFAIDATIGNMSSGQLQSKYEVGSASIRAWKKSKWYGNLMLDFSTALHDHQYYLQAVIEVNELHKKIAGIKKALKEG